MRTAYVRLKIPIYTAAREPNNIPVQIFAIYPRTVAVMVMKSKIQAENYTRFGRQLKVRLFDKYS